MKANGNKRNNGLGDVSGIGSDGAEIGGSTILPINAMSVFQVAGFLAARGFDTVGITDDGKIAVWKKGRKTVFVEDVEMIHKFEKDGDGYRRSGGEYQIKGNMDV